MFIARIEEQFGVLNLIDMLPGRVDVALANKVRIGVRNVNLNRHCIRPRPEVISGHARIEQQSAAGFGTGLRKFLCRYHTEGKTGIYDAGRELLRCFHALIDELLEASLLNESHSLFDNAQCSTREEVRRVYDVVSIAQGVGELLDTVSESQRMVKKYDLSHRDIPSFGQYSDRLSD